MVQKKVDVGPGEWKDFVPAVRAIPGCSALTEATMVHMWNQRPPAPPDEKTDEIAKATKSHTDLMTIASNMEKCLSTCMGNITRLETDLSKEKAKKINIESRIADTAAELEKIKCKLTNFREKTSGSGGGESAAPAEEPEGKRRKA